MVDGQDEKEPDPEGKGWSVSPADRLITLQVDNKKDNGNYRLYVQASDSLGNSKLYHTSGLFSVFYLSNEPPVGSARLIRTEGPGDDGYTAIMELTIDVPAQEGYFYSVSTNGGDNWSTWLPYTNYVGVPVDTNDSGQLKSQVRVKFKGYYDNISDICTPGDRASGCPCIWACFIGADHPVRGGEKLAGHGGQNEGQEILFDLVDGKTVKPTNSNPEMPETLEANKRFKIYRNGSILHREGWQQYSNRVHRRLQLR